MALIDGLLQECEPARRVLRHPDLTVQKHIAEGTFGGGVSQVCSLLVPNSRGSHSSTFRLNVSALCGIGGAFGKCVGGVQGVLGGSYGVFGVCLVSETAQVELESGRV